MSVFGAVQLKDENGTAYGVKHFGNKPRVSAMPYAYDIAEGNVANHANYRKLGYNTAVGTTLEDITTTGAKVNVPAAAAAMEVYSSSANDAGSATYDATATGGTATTLVDTNQDFTAGSVVAAGDIVLLDDDVEFGIVTSVAATTLTCSAGFSGSITPESGDNYRVVDVSAGGTGTQLVEIEGLDGNYAEIMEFVVTNGTTEVATANSYLRINNFHSMAVGTGLASAGTVDLRGTADTPIYDQIAAGGNMSLQCHYTVPAGKTMYITDWSGGVSGTKAIRLVLRATCDFDDRVRLQNSLFHFQDIILALSADVQHVFQLPLKVPEKCDVKVSGNTLSTTGEASASIGFWTE